MLRAIRQITLFLLLALLPCESLCQNAANLDSLEQALHQIDAANLKKIIADGERLVSLSDSHQQKFAVYSFISEAHFNQNKIDQSIAYLFKAKDVAEQAHDPKLSAQAYGSIANQYSYLNLTQKARTYLNLATNEIEKLPEGATKHKFRALGFLELGNLDFNDGDYKSANANYRKSLSEFDKIKDKTLSSPYHYRRSLYNIGNSYYYLMASDPAEEYLNRALAFKDEKNHGLEHYIKATLAEVYAQKKNYKRAIDTLQTILKDTTFHVNSLKTEIYLNLSRNYKAVGDSKNYALYNDKYIALRNEVNSQDMKAINTAFEAEQQDLASQISASEARTRWLIAILAAALVTGIGISAYALRQRRNETSAYKSIIAKLENRMASISEHQNEDVPENDEPRYSVSPTVEKSILEGLQKFESDQEFRDAELTLPNLATKLKTNPAYVSAVIRMHKNGNFNSYVNELRIRYICSRLYENPEYLNYKISYLAEDSGFVSHSAFSTIFKKVTGISPSSFIRQAKKAQMPKPGSKPAA